MTKPVSIFDLYATDKTSEEEGKWFDEFGPEISIKIRRYSSAKSRKTRDELFKPYLKQFKTSDKIPENIAEMLTVEHLATAVIVDWKGVFDREGNEVSFSADRAREILTALPDLSREIVLLSINMDNYRAEAKEEIKGN